MISSDFGEKKKSCTLYWREVGDGAAKSEADMPSKLSNNKKVSAFHSSEPLHQSSISTTTVIVRTMVLIPD